MVHVSFDRVEQFVPRVPKQRIEGDVMEDAATKRICVAPDVRHALRAIPQCGEVLRCMRDFRMPLIVHAYYLKGDVYTPTAEQVPDVEWTQERWLLQEPESVYRVDYELSNLMFVRHMDANGGMGWFCTGCDMKRTHFQSNWENLVKALGGIAEKSEIEKKLKCSFRTLLSNLGDEIISKHCSKIWVD